MATAANIASSEAGYVWEDPGDSIMVQLSLDLIERLGAAIQQGIGTGPRGAEVGGILLGRVLPGMGRAVLVEDVEPIPCEHFRGASFALSPRDRRVLSSRLSRRDPRQVVGYFRSHTRPGMYLDQDDFAVFSQYFPEAWQVLLLVRPSTDAVATGGFFFGKTETSTGGRRTVSSRSMLGAWRRADFRSRAIVRRLRLRPRPRGRSRCWFPSRRLKYGEGSRCRRCRGWWCRRSGFCFS